jgi:hypothetical protein
VVASVGSSSLTPAAPTATVSSVAQAAPAPVNKSVPATGRAGRPADFKLDGNLAEWGKLEVPPAKKGESATPADVIFALTKTSLTIAGRVRGAKEGVSVRFDFVAGELPPLGTPLRGGGLAPLDCESTWDHQPLDEAAKVECKKIVAKAATFEAEWKAEFFRDWQFDAKGVWVAMNGKRTEVAGASSAFTATADDATFEVEIPIDALPLANESPVAGASVFVAPTRAWKEPSFEQQVGVGFDAGVPFGDQATLRAKAIEVWGANIINGASAFGYRLGDDISWIDVGRSSGWLSYRRSQVPLFDSIAKHKVFEVGVLYAGLGRMATLKGNDVVSLELSSPGRILGSLTRKPGLHVFSYDEYTDEVGNVVPSWTVYVVDETGEVTAQGLSSGVFSWSSVSEFHLKSMASFGLKGQARTNDGSGDVRNVTVTYKYDAAAGWYEPIVKGLD